MKAYFSKCNEDEVVVFVEGEDEPERCSREDFLAMYGEEALAELSEEP